MNKMEEILDKIKKLPVTEYTTQDLKELGLTKYSLTKLVADGTLERIRIGHYILLKDDVKARRAFNKFNRLIHKQRFDDAYLALLDSIKYRAGNHYDMHTALYLLMLKELINPNLYDVSVIKQLDYHVEPSDNSDSYYEYFNHFKFSLFDGDFNQAYEALKKFQQLEFEQLGYNKRCTLIFKFLLQKVCFQSFEFKNNLSNSSQMSPKLRSKAYGTTYSSLKKCLEEERYEQALNLITDLKKYSYEFLVPEIETLFPMLETLIKMIKEKIYITPNDYHYFGADYDKIFHKALEDGDYLTAYQNIGKVMFQNKYNRINDLRHIILEKIFYLNQENINATKKQEKVEEPVITQSLLADLLYNRQYSEAKKLLDKYQFKHKIEDRIFLNARHLIIFMDQLHNNQIAYEQPDVIYESSSTDLFHYFFEAMRHKDYVKANELVTSLEDITLGRDKDDLEFTIYRYLLEDVCLELDRYSANLEIHQEINNLDIIINNYIYKKDGYSLDDLEKFKEAIERRMTLFEQLGIELPTKQLDINLLNIIDLIKKMTNCHGTMAEYFATIDNKSLVLVDRFNYALENGDLYTALETIMDPSWIFKTQNIPNRRYFEVYKKLLKQLKLSLERKVVITPLTLDVETSSPLKELRSYIKKRDYIGAYEYYLNNDFSDADKSLEVPLAATLAYLKASEAEILNGLLDQYALFYRRGDYDQAQKYLDDYQKMISKKDNSRNLDYLYERTMIEKQRINAPSFTQMEQLYDWALKQYEVGNDLGCLTTLEEYFKLDNLPYRGYILRGHVYERLGDKENALADYSKAIALSHDPEAYYALGVLQYQSQLYDKALENFKAYEERLPVSNLDNIEMLVRTYDALGDSDNSRKYQKILEVKRG